MSPTFWHLFQVYGVEVEYMIVDRENLDIRPWADRVLVDTAGLIHNEVEHGPITWCNELARHVVELKCTQPTPQLQPTRADFQTNIDQLNQQLAAEGAMLLPGGMHPWMDPHRELELWPLQNQEIYGAYDRIFSCHGHGWANLQSVQINLPFADDHEFGVLHAAIRTVLPLLCGLAASTPYADGRFTGFLDYRMQVYRHNSDRIPSVTGQVIPEAVFSIDAYQQQILQPMYTDIAPLDSANILQGDWLNSRGAIARFERQSIEIRTLDSQECADADLALVIIVSEVVRALCEERWSSRAQQQSLADTALVHLFLDSITRAEHTALDNSEILSTLGLPKRTLSLNSAWGHIINRLAAECTLPEFAVNAANHILSHGTLASRLVNRIGRDLIPTVAGDSTLKATYRDLAHCLATNTLFK